MPSEEEGMVAALKKKNVEIQKIKIKASKTQEIANQLQKLAFQDPEIKYLGQRVSSAVSHFGLHANASSSPTSGLRIVPPLRLFAEGQVRVQA